MYWKLRMQPPSAIDGLLSSEDCQLEAVLDEEGLLDELKTSRNLLEFLTREDNLNQIVALVVEEPAGDLPENIKYRRAQIAASLFGVDQAPSTTLVDKVASSEALLNKLWSFLDQSAPLNSLLASFFSRAMHCILQCKTTAMLVYVRKASSCLEGLLNHIDTSAIMDLLLSFLITCESYHLRCQLVDWFRDCHLVERLVSMIHVSCGEDKQRNASRALAEMIRVCYDQMSRSAELPNNDPLLLVLESDATLQALLTNMFDDPTARAPILRGTSVIQAMLSVQQGSGGNDTSPGDAATVTNKEAARSVVARLTAWLPKFHHVLLHPPAAPPILTSAGAMAVPLGTARLTVVQLLMVCLQLNVEDFTQDFNQLNICSTLLDLFLEYVWNNFLHALFEQLVMISLHGKEAQYGKKSLAELLLVDNHLMRRLATAGLDNERTQHMPGGHRRGYMGHVISISNAVLATMAGDADVSAAVQQLDDEEMAVWKEWVDGPLESANQKNNASLGGQHPSEEEDAGQLEQMPALDDVQQAFLNYQITQLTSEFGESFGFSDQPNSASEVPVTAPFDEIIGIDFELNTDMESDEPDMFALCCEAQIIQPESPGAEPEAMDAS